MDYNRNANKIFVENPDGRDQVGELSFVGKIILTLILLMWRI